MLEEGLCRMAYGRVSQRFKKNLDEALKVESVN